MINYLKGVYMKTFFKVLLGFVLTVGLFTFAFYRTPAERAFTKNFKLANAGDATAAWEVAQAYQTGNGTNPNLQQALQWYEQAVARGSEQAAWKLYSMYATGDGVAANLQTAITYLQIAAQANYAPAQEELGNLYLQGEGVAQHPGQALYWYITAAENGSSSAKARVDSFSTQEPDLYAKVTRFMQALQEANKPEASAQYEVAQAYRKGEAVLPSEETAHEWLQKAWETSNGLLPQVAVELAQQYAQGLGVDKDEQQAANFWAQAAQLKDPQAQYQMGSLAYAEEPARLEDAFAWFSNAAMQGYAPAQYMTGFMLMQGQGTQASVPLAIRFFEQAAEQGDTSAQYVLGQIFIKGLGVKRSRAKGLQWLEKAAANGNESAQELLAQVKPS